MKNALATPELRRNTSVSPILITQIAVLQGRNITVFEEAKDVFFDLSELTEEYDIQQNELIVVYALMNQCIYENANVALDQADYQKFYDGFTKRFDKAKAR